MRTFLVGVAALALVGAAWAQDVYKVRLRPVPVDERTRGTVTGAGQATATLAGTKLSVNGTVEGLQGSATSAKIFMGPKMGVRGNPILDLTIAKAADGALTGTVDLSAQQVEALKAGRLYIQVASDKAPDGNLWGWLTK